MMTATQLLDPLSHTRWLGNSTDPLLRTTQFGMGDPSPGWPLGRL
jgi:hypothetical protein